MHPRRWNLPAFRVTWNEQAKRRLRYINANTSRHIVRQGERLLLSCSEFASLQRVWYLAHLYNIIIRSKSFALLVQHLQIKKRHCLSTSCFTTTSFFKRERRPVSKPDDGIDTVNWIITPLIVNSFSRCSRRRKENQVNKTLSVKLIGAPRQRSNACGRIFRVSSRVTRVMHASVTRAICRDVGGDGARRRDNVNKMLGRVLLTGRARCWARYIIHGGYQHITHSIADYTAR